MTHLSHAHFNSHLWKSLKSSDQTSAVRRLTVPALAQRNTGWLTEDAFIAGIYLFSTLSGKTVTFQLGTIVASQWVWAWPRRTSFWRRCSPIRPSVLMRSRPKTSSRTAGLTRRTRRDLSACTSRWPWDWRRSPRSRARTDPRHNTQPQVCPRALWSHCNTATITQQPLNY